MDFSFKISLPYGNFYYDFFYQLSFIIGFAIFLFVGWRRKYPLATWILISVFASVFVIFGSKIGTYSLEDWNQFLTTGSLPVTSKKTMIGALIFGWIGVGIAQRLLHFRASVLDVNVLALPFAMIIQRLGCLATGCCFGNPSSENWGVCYSQGHLIYDYQLQEGLISSGAAFTNPVHPIPLYIIIGLVGIIFILQKVKTYWRSNGSLALFGLVLIFGLRFVIEFFRNPITNHGQGEIFYGLKIIQWILLASIIFFSCILFLREKKWTKINIPIPSSEENFYRNIWVAFLITLLIALGKDWFTIIELKSIFVRILLCYFALGIIFFKYFFKKPAVKWSISLCLMSIVLMSQTYIDKGKKESFEPHKENSIQFGTIYGQSNIKYVDTEYTGGGGGCGGPAATLVRADTISIGPHYTSMGFNYNHRFFYKPNKFFKFNGYGMVGNYPKTVTSLSGESTYELSQLRAIGLMFNKENRRFGIGIGGIFGKWGVLSRREERYDSRISMSLRIGAYDDLHLFANLFYDDTHPYASISSYGKVGINLGSSFFKWNKKNRIRIGVTDLNDKSAIFLEGDIFLTDHIYLSPVFKFSENHQYGFGLGYRW